MGQAQGATLFRGIEYDPWPSQQRFHDSRRRFKAFSGPVGAGKSSALAQEAIRLSYVNIGLWGLLAAPTYRMLHDVTERTLFDILDDNGIPYKQLKADDAVRFEDTGSHIIFRSTDKPERLRGTNLAWFGIDELSYVEESAFQRLQARLREPRATELVGFGVMTPAGLNWCYDRFKGDKKSPDYELIEAPPGENKALAQGYYEALAKSYDERFYRQEVLGEFLSLTSGTAYYAFDRSRNLVSSLEYDSSSRLCWSLDFNIDPMCSVVGQLRDYAPAAYLSSQKTRKLEILDEIVLRDANVHLACQRFCEVTEKWVRLLGGRRVQVNVYGDPAGNSRNHAGKTDWQMVREYFTHRPEYQLVFNVPSAHPAVRDRVNAVNGALFSATGEVKLTIHPRCQTLIRDLERVTWAKDTHGNAIGEVNKKDPSLTHACFAAGTMVELESGPCVIEQAPAKGRVRTWDGSFVPYENVGLTQKQAEMVKLSLSDRTIVYCTQEHLWLTPQGWIQARNLQGHQLSRWQSRLSGIPDKTLTARSSTDTTVPSDTSGVPVGKVHIVSVEHALRQDTYCLHVPSAGCFALADGAIVSNSDAAGYLVEQEFSVLRTGGGYQRERVI